MLSRVLIGKETWTNLPPSSVFTEKMSAFSSTTVIFLIFKPRHISTNLSRPPTASRYLLEQTSCSQEESSSGKSVFLASNSKNVILRVAKTSLICCANMRPKELIAKRVIWISFPSGMGKGKNRAKLVTAS